MLVFGLHAMIVGGFFSRIAEVQRELGFSETTFGLVLTGVPVGVILGTLVVSRLVEGWGTRRVMAVNFTLFAMATLAAGAVSGFGGFFAALAAFGFTLSLANVAMNVEADRVALATDRPMISKSHGTWGLGFLLATAGAALAIRAGVTPEQQFWVVAGIVLLAVAVLILPLAESPPRKFARSGPPPRFAMPDRGNLLILAFAASGILLEGITRSWSVIYLRDAFGAADWVAALTLPSIVVMQTAGRFLSDTMARRLGEIGLARMMSSVTLAGVVLLVLTPSITLALLACALIGFGISITHPMATVANARRPDRPASENVAAFASLQNVLAFLGPSGFGLIAGATDLRVALACLLPLPFLAWYFAKELRP
jgi:predicted MFS family arabinose efflux permease